MNWYSISDAPRGVPILDFKQLQDSAPEKKTLREVLFGSGVFYLSHSGISKTRIHDLISVTANFFELGREEKEKMTCRVRPLRGYSALKSENLARFLNTGDFPDLCSKYSWAHENNFYPNEKFRVAWQTYYDAAGGVLKQLLKTISQILEKELNCTPQDWQQIIQGQTTLRHLSYPDLRESQKLAMASHTDLGSLSLLYQTPTESGHKALEVEIDGSFVPVPAIPDTLVVFVGEVLTHISEGKMKATRHRVVHTQKPHGARTSTILFGHPDMNFNVNKFSGSTFMGMRQPNTQTYGEIIESDLNEYVYAKSPL